MSRLFLYLSCESHLLLAFCHRQGYDDYQRANRSAYSEYYADYAKHYDYGGMSHRVESCDYLLVWIWMHFLLLILYIWCKLFFCCFHRNGIWYKSPSLPLNIFCWKDTTMDTMTRDTEVTMISPTGLIMMRTTEAEKTTIINRCILPGMQRKPFAHSSLLLHWCIFGKWWSYVRKG